MKINVEQGRVVKTLNKNQTLNILFSVVGLWYSHRGKHRCYDCFSFHTPYNTKNLTSNRVTYRNRPMWTGRQKLKLKGKEGVGACTDARGGWAAPRASEVIGREQL